MTEEEIQIAFERSGIFTNVASLINTSATGEERINIPSVQQQITHPYNHKMSTFEKIKDVISSAALISGICYAFYMFYKVCIIHFL